MRALFVSLALGAVGCGGIDDGRAVDLTLAFDASVTDAQIATITRLHVVVSGQESYTTDVQASGKLSGRKSALRYRPGASSGTLHFAIDAFASTDVPLATGKLDVTLGGGTELETLTLVAVPPVVVPACGNGVVDSGESCDDGTGSPMPCPHTTADCDDANDCTSDSLAGSDCSAHCLHTPGAASAACTTGSTVGVCVAAACCTGCVAGDGSCQPGSVAAVCGTAGNACFDCSGNSASSTCDSGQCSGCDATSCTSSSQTCGTSSCGFNCGSCPDSCAGGMLTPFTCAKTCQAGTPSACPNDFVCASATACKTSCASDSDCITSAYCNAAQQCVPKLGNSSNCSRAGVCTSGICADGVCCDGQCGDSCEACNVAGHIGSCTPQPAMQPPAAGHAACVSDGSSCGGSCNGSVGTCTYSTGSCSESPFVGTCSNGKCGCPASSVFCAANGDRCTSTTYNELACGSGATACSGATPACYTTGCAAVAAHTALVSGFTLPTYTAHDQTRLYVMDAGQNILYQVSKQAASKAPFVTPAAKGFEVVTDGTNVYYAASNKGTGSGGIWKQAATATSGTEISMGSNPTSIAMDATYAYFADRVAGAIERVPLVGGTTTVIASGQSGSNDLVSDGTFVYWANGGAGSVARVSVNGGAVQVLAANQAEPWGIAVDTKYVYWSNVGTYDSTGTINNGDGSVWKVPLAGGTAVPLLQHLTGPQALRVDGVAVYVELPKIGVYKIPLCGGPALLIAPDTDTIGDLEVDDTRIYYTRATAGDLQTLSK